MLYTIKFNSEQFDSNNNKLVELTNNTIILCESSSIKRKIADEIMKLFDDYDYKNVDYYDCGDIYNIEVQYKPTTILNVLSANSISSIFYSKKNISQKIIITTEVPFVLQCKDSRDLWFAQIDENNKIHLYAFNEFKGYENEWNKGIYNVYKCVLSGIYGNFIYGN